MTLAQCTANLIDKALALKFKLLCGKWHRIKAVKYLRGFLCKTCNSFVVRPFRNGM